MSIRSEIESKIQAFAGLYNLPVAYEGIPFTPPDISPFLEVVFLDKAIYSRDISIQTKTVRGMFQVNVYCLDKRGSAEVEELAEMVAALFPYADSTVFETIIIDNHPQIGRAMIDDNFRFVPITIEYRQESGNAP